MLPNEPAEPEIASVSEPVATGALDADVVRAIEAIVLVATEPVPTDQLAQLLELSLTTVHDLCSQLADSYDQAGHGFQFVKVAGGWRYQTHADMSPYVERFLLDGQRARMSGAALETLAIVAYKQPISRAQIASIRGVDPDGVLRTLAARGYVTQVAIDPGPGQAALFGTTPQFLEKLGLNSLADLPPLAEFVPAAAVVEALEYGLRAHDADPKLLRAHTPELPETDFHAPDVHKSNLPKPDET
jgi:segregation and condensation protein B